MKRTWPLLILFFLLLGYPIKSALAQRQDLYTLNSCYELALKRSFTLKDNATLIEQARARISEARSAFLPNVDFSYSRLKQDKIITTDFPGASMADNPENTEKFTASYTIFNGFKNFTELHQHQHESKGYEQALEAAQMQLFNDVASAYYTDLQYEADLINYSEERKSYQDRLSEISRMMKVGRARQSDYLSVESSLDSLEANMASTQGLLDAQKEVLSFLTGLSDDIILDGQSLSYQDRGLDYWLGFVDERALVKEAEENLKAAKEQALSARSGYLPTIDIDGDYYTKRQDGNSKDRWDTTLTVTMPIYNGGDTYSQVREYRALIAEKENALEQLKNESIRDIRSAYKTFVDDQENEKRLSRAAQKSKEYYEALKRDNAQGLATNLDTLIALANYYEIKRGHDRALFATAYSFAKLKSLTSTSIDQLE